MDFFSLFFHFFITQAKDKWPGKETKPILACPCLLLELRRSQVSNKAIRLPLFRILHIATSPTPACPRTLLFQFNPFYTSSPRSQNLGAWT